MKSIKIRLPYLVATVILIVTEILIALYVHDSFVRPYGGDILVVILIYCLLRVAIPTGVPLLPLYVFLFACGVEVLQYLDFVSLLGLDRYEVARIALGTSFSFVDILCYLVGCSLTFVLKSRRR